MIVADRVRAENRVVIAHVYTATAAIALGAIFGVFQGFARTGAFEAPAWFDYYRMLTMHGVLMALVFTTFFITGLSLFVTYRAIPRERSLVMGWFGWGLMLAGTAMAAVTILKGDATVFTRSTRRSRRARGSTSARRCWCWERGSSRSRSSATSTIFARTIPDAPFRWSSSARRPRS